LKQVDGLGGQILLNGRDARPPREKKQGGVRECLLKSAAGERGFHVTIVC